MQNINRRQLFIASCLALLVTSLSFGIRAGMLNRLGVEFGLDKSELGTITATAFWGFPLAVIIGGMVVDAIGMRRLLMAAFIFHSAGILLTVFADQFPNPFWSLFLSTLLIGIANGTVEAACNPLVTTLYPDNKTTKLSHFHLWFPAGIVLGTLIVYFSDKVNLGWQPQMLVMLLPALVYGYMFSRVKFPVTERVSSGISTREMYRSLLSPLFIVMIICMLGTSITELFTNQWIDVLLKSVTSNSILILTVSTGVMVLGRAFAGPIVKRLAPQGVLLMSAIIATLGLYILANTTGAMIFAGAVIFGIGVCYFWPAMLGFVAEYLPESGAVGINLMGGAGMLAVSFYMILMGGYYDRIIAKELPAGAVVALYNSAEATDEMKEALMLANKAAGPQIITTTLMIPCVLILAFTGLYFYMKKTKRVYS